MSYTPQYTFFSPIYITQLFSYRIPCHNIFPSKCCRYHSIVSGICNTKMSVLSLLYFLMLFFLYILISVIRLLVSLGLIPMAIVFIFSLGAGGSKIASGGFMQSGALVLAVTGVFLRPISLMPQTTLRGDEDVGEDKSSRPQL